MAEKPLLPIYLIIGPDEVKRDTVITRMRDRHAKSGLADFNLDEREAPADEEAESVLASLNTYPMGADFRLVILRSFESAGKAVSEVLVDYLKNPSPTTVCLVQAKTLAKSTRLYKAAAKIDSKAIIDCSAKKPREIPAQVQQLAKRHGKDIGADAAQALVARVGENTRMLDNELKRLAAMCEAPVIDRAFVEEHVARIAEVKPWELTDAVSERNLSLALKYLHLQPEKNYMFVYLLLCSRLRELIRAKSAERSGGLSTEALGLKANMKWKLRDYSRWARKFSDSELERALKAAVDVELALKGSGDSETALTVWISQICASRDKTPALR